MNRQFFGKLFDFAGGLFAGAALWFLSGLLIYWLWSLLPSYLPVSSSSAAFAVFNIVISVFLVRSITKNRGKIILP